MRRVLLAGLAGLLLSIALAGCGAPLASSQDAPTEPLSAPPCTPAQTDNRGTRVNEYYIEGAELWEESNGITNLQRTASCEGPADTLVAP